MNMQPFNASLGWGCVERHVIESLTHAHYSGPEMTTEITTTIAERSPLGPRAVRLHVAVNEPQRSSAACDALATWLKGQPWADGIVVRPPNVYVRIGTDALHHWVADEFFDPHVLYETHVDMDEHTTIIHLGILNNDRQMSLDSFRRLTVGGSIAMLLTLMGHAVAIEPISHSDKETQAPPLIDIEMMARIDAHQDNISTNRLKVAVEGVDIRHGPLRARFGGGVSADDLMHSLMNHPLEWAQESDTTLVRHWYGQAALRFVMLRTERARRVQLDDVKWASEVASFDTVLAAWRIAWTHSEAGLTSSSQMAQTVMSVKENSALRDVAAELDQLAHVAVRATSELEPALLMRYLRALAECTHAAQPYIEPADPLWRAIHRAFDTALEWVGIGAPPLVTLTAMRDSHSH